MTLEKKICDLCRHQGDNCAVANVRITNYYNLRLEGYEDIIIN